MPAPKLHINAKQAVADIRRGMSDAELMAKYGLSEIGLQKLFHKLLEAGSVTPDELKREPISLPADPVERTCPACGKVQPEDSDECPFCGIILAKFSAQQQAQSLAPTPLAPQGVQSGAPPVSVPARKPFIPDVSVIVAAIGCLLLLVGALVPVLHVPHQGRLNFLQLGEVAPRSPAVAYFVIAMGFASGIMVAFRQERWLWVSGCGCLIVLGYTFIQLRQGIRRLSYQFGSVLEGKSPSFAGQQGPLTGFQDIAQQMLNFQMDVGWVVLFVGAILLIAAACIAFFKGSTGRSFSR